MKKGEIKKLDKLWSEKVKDRAGYICEHCLQEGYELHPGHGVWLNAAHIIGRRYRSTRWLLDNGMCLCFGCHKEYDEHGPHHDDIKRRVVGEERFARLARMAKQSVAKYQDYSTIKLELEGA